MVETFIEILKYIVPMVVVFAFIYFVIHNYLDQLVNLKQAEVRQQTSSTVLNIRLQSYERMVLYLDRITPSSLIQRMHKTGMSARLLHTEMLKTIRSEFEHNIAQQIYMSNASWELVKSAKEETIKLVNAAFNKVGENGVGIDMCKILLEIIMNVDKLPTQIAVDYLKKEIRQSF
jgi:flagellar biosynthesis protein FlhB